MIEPFKFFRVPKPEDDKGRDIEEIKDKLNEVIAKVVELEGILKELEHSVWGED